MIRMILWELKQRKKALLWWIVGSIAMTLTVIALFPSIQDKAAEMNQVINQLPSELRGLKAGATTSVDVGNPREFLNSQLYYITLPLIWILLAITRGAAILGKEERSGTLELLLARPISRGRIYIAKSVALLAEMLIVAMATLLATLIFAPLFDLALPVHIYALVTFGTALFCWSFGYAALAITAFGRFAKRAAGAVAVLLSFGGYLIASLSSFSDWLQTPAKLVPYHYFDPLQLLDGHISIKFITYMAIVAIFCTAFGYTGFRRRDLSN